ncbi:MAG: efflux RND transporter permease subunit [Chlamydiota bacterium]
MNLSGPFIKRPVMTFIVMASILLLGLLSFKMLPVTDLPNVEYPSIGVQAQCLGASPEVMASSVAAPLEKELMNIEGLKHITSFSTQGSVWLNLMFDLDRSGNAITEDVQSALEKAEKSLPIHLDERPTYHKTNPNQDAIIYLVVTSHLSSLAELHEYANSCIKQKISHIPGVGQVQIHGSRYAVRISLNPELMAARGLTFDEVKSVLKAATKTLPLGELDTPGRTFSLEIPGSFQNAADFSRLLIKPHVYLKDIATVLDGAESKEVFHYVTKDQNTLAVIIGVQKQAGANAVKISEEIARLLPEIRAELPPSMEVKLWFDKALWIKEAILDIEWSLVLSLILVSGVVFLSLRNFRETLIASTALPLSIVGTFIFMRLLHFNLDLLSILALTLAMGFVIDDAIVVLENIVRYKEKGMSPLQAALEGSKQVSFTVISMTLSLIAVFIPLLFMHSVTGRLFREFSVTLAASVLVSGFISLTLIPMLAAKFLSPLKKGHVELKVPLLAFYKRTLKWCLSHRKSTIAFACIPLLFSGFLFRFLPVNLFPEEDRGFIWSYIQIPSDVSKAERDIYQDKLITIVQQNSDIESFVVLDLKDYQCYLIRLTSSKRLSQSLVIAKLQERMNAIPGVQAFMRGVQLIDNTMGGVSGNNYQFVLRGPNHAELCIAAENLKQKLLLNPTFINPALNIQADVPKLEITLLEDFIEKLGLSRQDVQSLLQGAYAGGSIGNIEKNTESYKVFLGLDSYFQKNSNALASLYLKTPTGDAVPLKAVASWKETTGLQSIQHMDLLPSVTLSFDVDKAKPVNESFALLKKIADETFPPSVHGKLEGVADMMDDATKDTILLLLFALVAMYVILSILYESFIHPLTILSALPFACLGGILTLLICKEPLSLYSMVGFLLLIGIVKKNGIMIVDYAVEMQRKEGKTSLIAIEEACLIRFRPIMMTTVAAVVGALPIAIGIGAGAETRRGLGLVIAGGLIFSQFLTLYITPILYLYFERLRSKILIRDR